MNAVDHLPIKQTVAKLAQFAEQVTQARKEEEQWDAFKQVYATIEDLKKRQRKRKSREVGNPTEKDFNEFKDWLISNGMAKSCFENVDFTSFSEGGGVVAKKDFQKGDLVFTVPKNLLLSSVTPKERNTRLWQAISQDPILTHFSSEPLLLALQLLCEKHDTSSFWTPYIKILPRFFHTCLSYSLAELEALKGSPAFAHARRIINTVAKHYCYIFGLLENNCHIMHVASFTWEEFVWATSVAMTRQNLLPLQPGSGRLNYVLIPAWDMCNHDDGEISTFYEAGENAVKCQAMRTFKRGQQVYIFYGVRSNLDLLLQQGFVFDNNSHNFLNVKLGLPHDVTSIKEKLTLLQFCNLKMYSQFDLFGDGVPAQMLGFLRIHVMNEEEVKAAIEQGKDKFDPFNVINPRNEQAAYELALEKLKELLSAYPTTLEEDERLVKTTDISYNLRSIMKLRAQEKRLILSTIGLIERALGRTPSTTVTVSPGNNSASAPTTNKKKKKKNKNKKKKANRAASNTSNNTTGDAKPQETQQK